MAQREDSDNNDNINPEILSPLLAQTSVNIDLSQEQNAQQQDSPVNAIILSSGSPQNDQQSGGLVSTLDVGDDDETEDEDIKDNESETESKGKSENDESSSSSHILAAQQSLLNLAAEQDKENDPNYGGVINDNHNRKKDTNKNKKRKSRSNNRWLHLCYSAVKLQTSKHLNLDPEYLTQYNQIEDAARTKFGTAEKLAKELYSHCSTLGDDGNLATFTCAIRERHINPAIEDDWHFHTITRLQNKYHRSSFNSLKLKDYLTPYAEDYKLQVK